MDDSSFYIASSLPGTYGVKKRVGIDRYFEHFLFPNAFLTLATLASSSSLVNALMMLPWTSVIPP